MFLEEPPMILGGIFNVNWLNLYWFSGETLDDLGYSSLKGPGGYLMGSNETFDSY